MESEEEEEEEEEGACKTACAGGAGRLGVREGVGVREEREEAREELQMGR
jgi:hypothetical protein